VAGLGYLLGSPLLLGAARLRYPLLDDDYSPWLPWLGVSLGVGALVVWIFRGYFLTLRTGPETRQRMPLWVTVLWCAALALCQFFLTFGALQWWNGAMDRSTPAVVEASVTKGAFWRVKDGMKFSLTVEVPGWSTQPLRLEVRKPLYEATLDHPSVQLTLGRGALGIPWIREMRPGGGSLQHG